MSDTPVSGGTDTDIVSALAPGHMDTGTGSCHGIVSVITMTPDMDTGGCEVDSGQ